MTITESAELNGAFLHPALFYASAEEYTSGIVRFLADGLAAGEPAFVAVPGPHLDLLRSALGSAAGAVAFADMTDVGRNPSRIIPAISEFTRAHPGRTRFVGEPIWAGRSAAEIREATRHEALINAAFAGVPTTILCPYDTSKLPAAVLQDAWRTHPGVRDQAGQRPSPAYDASGFARAIAEQSPAAAPAGAAELAFGQQDLPRLRHLVEGHATHARIGGTRARLLVFAVNEVATNTVAHAEGTGTLRIWRAADSLVCEVSDPGRITDPLAGRRLPSPLAAAGHGLFVVNQVCDLVELRSGPWGTSVRMHARCAA